MATNTFVQSSWGRLRLWLGTTETDNSRTIVVHDLSSGDHHPTRDQGLATRRVRASLLFDEFDGESETPTARFRAFKAAVDAGVEAIFTHPIGESFLATVGPFNYTLEPGFDYPTTVTVEFIPVDEVEPISPAGAGTSGVAGEGAVNARADELDAFLNEFLDFGEASSVTVTSDARAAAAAWNEGESVPTRQILVDTADISDKLATMIDDLGLEDDLALFDVFRASIMFGESVRAAALAATSEVPAVFVLRVMTVVAILPLMAKIYGGSEAEERARQVNELNDIVTPGWFGPGELLCPVKSRARSF